MINIITNKTNEPIVIQKIGSDQIAACNDFYKSVKYFHPILKTDIVITATVNSKIIGIVRLACENNLLVLRGMQVSEDFQKKGVGSLLLKELVQHIGSQECYCLPYDWLEKFYEQIGFYKIDDNQLPIILRKRLRKYRFKYPKMFVMKREIT